MTHAVLSTTRPTPSTVLYTVSTRSVSQTITARLAGYATILLRLAIGIVTAIFLLYELSISAALDFSSLASDLRDQIVSSPLGWFFSLLTTLLSTPWRLLVSVVVIWVISRKGYIEESLLVIRGLGVQTSTSSPSWLWPGGSTRFIPTNCVQDIFINEAFKGFEVRFYLGIVVEGEEDVEVAFPSILPRREVLEQVWRGAKACLYEPKP